MKEYDYVFSVDISDSAPPLKLPYNKGDDPWTTAQAFIHKHTLPQDYLDQVVDFIIKNSTKTSANPTLSTPSNSRYINVYFLFIFISMFLIDKEHIICSRIKLHLDYRGIILY